MNKKNAVKDLTLAAMFLALCMVLPLLTGQIPQIGSMLLPMHLPVLLCGLICGWKYGLIVGFIAPLLRFAIFGMPPMPMGIAMAFELATYGALVGFLYEHSRWQCVIALYRCLIIAMIGGRIVWAVARVIMLGVSGVPFGWEAFIAGAFTTAIPGIILQLILIPVIMVALNKAGLVKFKQNKKEEAIA